MKLGVNLGFITSSNPDPVPFAIEAERLGYDSVWVAEAWGSDAVSLLAWVGAKTERIRLGTAILQIPSRTPTLTAMTEATLDRLSGGRLCLGLGVSGPQVIEGWHSVDYGRPLTRTREAGAIIRAALERKQPLTYRGKTYQIPVEGGTGLGKPLKLMMSPERSRVPIYLAAIGPRNVALAAEIADGWLPIFFAPNHASVFEESPSRALATLVVFSLRRGAQRPSRHRRRSGALFRVGETGARALYRRHGCPREELLQRSRLPLWLRERGRTDSKPLPIGQEEGGDRRRSRSTRGRSRALRSHRTHLRSTFGFRLSAFEDAWVSTVICTLSDEAALRKMASLFERL